MFSYLYLNDLKNINQNSFIYRYAYDKMHENYRKNSSLERIAVDYTAGMTDNFINKEYRRDLIPRSSGYKASIKQ